MTARPRNTAAILSLITALAMLLAFPALGYPSEMDDPLPHSENGLEHEHIDEIRQDLDPATEDSELLEDASPSAPPVMQAQSGEEEEEEEDEDEDEEDTPQQAPARRPALTTGSPATAVRSVARTVSPTQTRRTTRTIETQLSGHTATDSDRLFARVSYREKRDRQDMLIRGSHSRSGTKYATSKTNIYTQRIDLRLETSNESNNYRILTGVLTRRMRERSGVTSAKAGYHLMSYGIGRELDPRTKGDIGLGFLNMYDRDDGTQPIILAQIRGRRPLNDKLTINGDIFGAQDIRRLSSTKVDSELALSYALSPGLSLRTSWEVNNLVRSIRVARTKEWDSTIRLSLSYRHSTTR